MATPRTMVEIQQSLDDLVQKFNKLLNKGSLTIDSLAMSDTVAHIRADIESLQKYNTYHANAEYALGQACEQGLGVAKNQLSAAVWWELAAKHGHPVLKKQQENMTATDYFIRGSYFNTQAQLMENESKDTAFKKALDQHAYHNFEKAANQGDLNAQARMVHCLYYGIGVARDKDKARRIAEKAIQEQQPLERELRAAFKLPEDKDEAADEKEEEQTVVVGERKEENVIGEEKRTGKEEKGVEPFHRSPAIVPETGPSELESILEEISNQKDEDDLTEDFLRKKLDFLTDLFSQRKKHADHEIQQLIQLMEAYQALLYKHFDRYHKKAALALEEAYFYGIGCRGNDLTASSWNAHAKGMTFNVSNLTSTDYFERGKRFNNRAAQEKQNPQLKVRLDYFAIRNFKRAAELGNKEADAVLQCDGEEELKQALSDIEARKIKKDKEEAKAHLILLNKISSDETTLLTWLEALEGAEITEKNLTIALTAYSRLRGKETWPLNFFASYKEKAKVDATDNLLELTQQRKIPLTHAACEAFLTKTGCEALLNKRAGMIILKFFNKLPDYIQETLRPYRDAEQARLIAYTEETLRPYRAARLAQLEHARQPRRP